jgi:cytochrome P450
VSTAPLIHSDPRSDPYSARSVAALHDEVLAALADPIVVMSAIGMRSPTRLVCATLGVPRRDWPMLSEWAWSWAHSGDATALDHLAAYVDVMVADRCYRLREDLLSALVMADANDGAGLTCDELRAIVTALVVS